MSGEPDLEAQFVIRPVREDDKVRLIALLGAIPDSITSLSSDPDYVEGRIHESLRAFYPVIREPGLEKYLFVLEERATGRLGGTCSVYAKTGGYEPFYTYEIVEEVLRHDALGIETRVGELQPRLDHEGPSELAGLYLHPDFRRAGLGGVLSRSRFLFMRLFPERFTGEVLAEFRGVVTESGEVPFWEAVGRHFFVKDFAVIDQYSATARKDFIHDLMPRHPIYIPLLPEAARRVIGEPHAAARPAVEVLEKEGFRFRGQVDIFDAGPIYGAELSGVRSYAACQRSRVAAVTNGNPGGGGRLCMIGAAGLDFRVTTGRVETDEDGGVRIGREVAEALGLERGSEVIYLTR